MIQGRKRNTLIRINSKWMLLWEVKQKITKHLSSPRIDYNQEVDRDKAKNQESIILSISGIPRPRCRTLQPTVAKKWTGRTTASTMTPATTSTTRQGPDLKFTMIKIYILARVQKPTITRLSHQFTPKSVLWKQLIRTVTLDTDSKTH